MSFKRKVFRVLSDYPFRTNRIPLITEKVFIVKVEAVPFGYTIPVYLTPLKKKFSI